MKFHGKLHVMKADGGTGFSTVRIRPLNMTYGVQKATCCGKASSWGWTWGWNPQIRVPVDETTAC